MHRSRHHKKGVVILDVLAGVFVLAMGAAAVFGLIPVVQKSQQAATDENRAVQIANRMIEHLHLLPPRDITVTNLKSLNLLDANQTGSPYSFTNVPMDDASRYSPAQVLKNASATLAITDVAANSKRATITLTWTSPSGRSRTLTTGTIVGGYR